MVSDSVIYAEFNALTSEFICSIETNDPFLLKATTKKSLLRIR